MQVSNSVYLYQSFRFNYRLRGSLIALIYQRTTSTRDADMGDITAVALMGTDVERIHRSLLMLHEAWASLVDIGVATWLLQQQLSAACVAPIILAIGESFARMTYFRGNGLRFACSICRRDIQSVRGCQKRTATLDRKSPTATSRHVDAPRRHESSQDARFIDSNVENHHGAANRRDQDLRNLPEAHGCYHTAV